MIEEREEFGHRALDGPAALGDQTASHAELRAKFLRFFKNIGPKPQQASDIPNTAMRPGLGEDGGLIGDVL